MISSTFRAFKQGLASGNRIKVPEAKENKAVYTAALVAGGWVEAENLEKQLLDRPTDQQTDRRTKK